MTNIELNADLGESFGIWNMGNDSAMMDIINRANIACGFHAGDPDIMAHTIELAMKKNIAIGAHPSFQDLIGFGRRRMYDMSIQSMQNMILYQIGALRSIAQTIGHDITHIKYHGALANMASEDDTLALGLLSHLHHYDSDLKIMVMAKTALERQSDFLKIPKIIEIFADRRYQDDGTLSPRGIPNSIIHDTQEICDHVVHMLDEQAIISINGKKIPTVIDSVCIHGDHLHAVKNAEKLRTNLENKGYTIKALS